MRVLLDTNLLARWLNVEDRDHATAKESLRVLRQQGHVPCLVPQNLYEFWSVATRPTDANGLGMSVSEANAEIQRFAPPLFRLLRDERAILLRWQELVSKYEVKGKVAHDAQLVAAMLRHGISHLLTFNEKDFTRFAEIRTVTPQAMASGAAFL